MPGAAARRRRSAAVGRCDRTRASGGARLEDQLRRRRTTSRPRRSRRRTSAGARSQVRLGRQREVAPRLRRAAARRGRRRGRRRTGHDRERGASQTRGIGIAPTVSQVPPSAATVVTLFGWGFGWGWRGGRSALWRRAPRPGAAGHWRRPAPDVPPPPAPPSGMRALSDTAIERSRSRRIAQASTGRRPRTSCGCCAPNRARPSASPPTLKLVRIARRRRRRCWRAASSSGWARRDRRCTGRAPTEPATTSSHAPSAATTWSPTPRTSTGRDAGQLRPGRRRHPHAALRRRAGHRPDHAGHRGRQRGDRIAGHPRRRPVLDAVRRHRRDHVQLRDAPRAGGGARGRRRGRGRRRAEQPICAVRRDRRALLHALPQPVDDGGRAPAGRRRPSRPS